MNVDDLTLLNLLADDTTRLVFDTVVKRRTVRLGELVKSVAGKIDREVAIEILGKLKEAELIEEKSSSLDDWTTFFVTADGLQAKRKISG